MFTGIVETIGRVAKADHGDTLSTFRIDVREIADGVAVGDSISVLGVCLTVTKIDGSILTFEVIAETLSRTRFGGLAAGAAVNLERAMAAGDRFDGHVVQGHVDGVGTVRRVERRGDDVELHVACDPTLAAQLVDKGSVTIDGVSLTVVEVVADGFHVALIPHTLEVTTLSDLASGDIVHLEVDVFGKYVKQYLDRILPGLVAATAEGRETANARDARGDASS